MGAVRYLLVIALVGLLSVLTVGEHVERTRLSYSIRELERERARLLEEQKQARLAYERAVVPERLIERATALGIASADELQALTGNAAQ